MAEERQYTEEEVAEILRTAAEAQDSGKAALTSGRGLTLSELEQIAREAGISTDAVRYAARSLDKPESQTRRFLGLPLGVGRTIELERKLTDEDWDRLVADLRETFDARGVVRQEGSLRSWSNGNLQALLEPSGNSQRLRLRTTKGNARNLMTVGTVMAGMAGVLTLAAVFKGTVADASVLSSQITVMLMGLGLFGAGAFGLPGWARKRREQMDKIADRMASRLPDV